MKVSAPFEPAIVAGAMEPMLAFYQGVLGMQLFSLDEIPAQPARAAGLSPQGYAIARLQTEGGDRLKIVVPQQPATPGARGDFVMQRHGFAYLTFIVPDVRAVIAALRGAGATVRTGAEPVAFRPGVVDLAFAEDPEGNCVEFVQRNDLATYRPHRAGGGA
ncbi:VOC family protein [Ramlibacter albus]|uniref:VOC family protein n=1 Tax=Ramlibacter albus TaxID=2079448 RepID=A0A923MBY3_9BURK|nr:VOC family protein [Ramlibacter albus]